MRYVQQSFVYVVCVPSACSKPNRIQVETLRMFTFRFSIALHIERCAQTNVSRHSNPHSHAVYTFSNKFVSILLILFCFVTTRDISSVFHCVSWTNQCILKKIYPVLCWILLKPDKLTEIQYSKSSDYVGFPSSKSINNQKTNLFSWKKQCHIKKVRATKVKTTTSTFDSWQTKIKFQFSCGTKYTSAAAASTRCTW